MHQQFDIQTQFSNVTIFSLNDDHISGSIPPGIANLVSLAILHAENNELSGKDSSYLRKSEKSIHGVGFFYIF